MSKYTNWNEEAQSFADQMQISVRDLTEVLAEIGNINFAVQAQRTQALDMYGNMTRAHVVAHDKQFPQFATYITMQMGDYAQIQAQLITALSYKEASEHRNDPVQTEKPNPRQQLRTSDSHSTGVLMNFNSTDDAKVSFFQAIRNFNIQLGRTGATIGRKTFEAKFGLEWK